MQRQECLDKMKSPYDVRHGIWRGGVIQIHITRGCDLACFSCTQGSNLAGKPAMISVEQMEEACRSIEGYFGVVGFFGGNPASHPKFEELCNVLCKHFPYAQRGLWCNNPLGKGSIMRRVFNPAVSNLNVHMVQAAYDEFAKDWPECKPYLKGHNGKPGRHSPPFVAMQDVGISEEDRWKLISTCDVNQFWSAMLCHVPGKGLRAFFCELAGAQAMLHAADPSWPDLGLEAVPGWWRRPMADYGAQVDKYCHACGIPLRRYGQLAVGEHQAEEVSVTHQDIYKPKKPNRRVDLIQIDDGKHLERATNYIENSVL